MTGGDKVERGRRIVLELIDETSGDGAAIAEVLAYAVAGFSKTCEMQGASPLDGVLAICGLAESAVRESGIRLVVDNSTSRRKR